MPPSRPSQPSPVASRCASSPPGPVALLQRLLADGWADPEPVCRVVAESALAGLEDTGRKLESARRPSDGLIDRLAAPAIDASFGAAFGEARRLVDVLRTAPA